MRSVHFLTDQEIFDRAVTHLYGQRRAALLPKGGAAYRGSRGGCPFGSFIRAADYASAMEGVPVRYLSGPALGRPSYMDAGIAALRKALLRARINVYDDPPAPARLGTPINEGISRRRCLHRPAHAAISVCAHDDQFGTVVVLTSLQASGDIVSHAVYFNQLGLSVDSRCRHRMCRFVEHRKAPAANVMVHRGRVVMAGIGENRRLLDQIDRMHLTVRERSDPNGFIQSPLRRLATIYRDNNLLIHEGTPCKTADYL
jgi:hypothetical protein